jgi:RND family efflux transporter MFP subunit
MSLQSRHEDYFKTLNSIGIPRPIRVVGLMLFISFFVVFVFLLTVPWVQTASGFGSVTAQNPNDRQQEINAFVEGRIQQWYVQDGSHVNTGDPIVEIVDNDPMLLERLAAERAQVMAKLAASTSAKDIAEIDMRRMRGLLEQGLVAQRDYEQARIRVEEARARIAENAAELTRVDVKLSRQSLQTVRAPRDGVILSLNAGDTATFVSVGQTIATFVPDNAERIVELYINGRDVALLRADAEVRLHFEGWPVVQISGWPSVAIGMFHGRVVAVDPSAQNDGKFRVLVEEAIVGDNRWPDERFVRFGSGVRGWVLFDTVSVGFEIWRQLNSFPPNFPETVSGDANRVNGGSNVP